MGPTSSTIDWKNVIENYVEDYHFPMGHPGLSALMESQYDRESFPGGTMRLRHRMREKPLRVLERRGATRSSCRSMEHLPEDMRRRWTYFGLFPNVYFDIYPEWMDFFHVLPLGAGRTLIRRRSFGFTDDRREMKAARFFCARLNARVQAEDEVLTASVQRGLASGAYTQGILSDKEVVLGGLPGLDPRADPGGAAGRDAGEGDDGGEERGAVRLTSGTL